MRVNHAMQWKGSPSIEGRMSLRAGRRGAPVATFKRPARLGRLVRMNPARLPEHRPHHQCRNQDTDPEKTGVPEMRGRVDGLCTQCFAEAISKNWPDRCGDGERQEIDRTGCTPLDLVGIYLFDDGVRDHGGTGSHT